MQIMRTLNETVLARYFHFKDNVLYNIDYTIGCDGKLGVSSVTEATKEVLIPSFTADDKTYYLDVLLKDGDKLEGDVLKHANCDGSLITLAEYYRNLCIEEIDNEIRRNPQATFELYNNVPSSLGIPLYMLKGHGSVSGIEQINFTEAFFDEHKKDVVKKECLKVAEAKANEYSYAINTLTVKKKSN